MSTISQLIKNANQYPVRRCYVKRRYLDGSYEPNWYRIDFLGNQDRVKSWGSFSLEVDFQPGQIGSFEISELTMKFDNQEGYFNVETDSQSIFYPDSTYINRRFTKIKIEAGFIDTDGTEVGVETVFEGVIDSIVISEDQTASITALPYSAILKQYLLVDLALTGSGTVGATVNTIMNQSKIKTYIPYVASSNTLNPTIVDRSTLEGSYWDVIKSLAQQSNSIPYLNATTWGFKDRSPGAVVWNFQGAGTQFPDIFNVVGYDDEGADRVRLYWQAEGTSITSISSDSNLKIKYFNSPQIINLDNYDNATKQTILDSLLAESEQNRPRIEFTTSFMVNEVDLLDKITIKIIGPFIPSSTDFVWGGWTWGDGSTWGAARGSINVSSGTEWMVTRIVKNIDDWMFQILAEKVV